MLLPARGLSVGEKCVRLGVRHLPGTNPLCQDGSRAALPRRRAQPRAERTTAIQRERSGANRRSRAPVGLDRARRALAGDLRPDASAARTSGSGGARLARGRLRGDGVARRRGRRTGTGLVRSASRRLAGRERDLGHASQPALRAAGAGSRQRELAARSAIRPAQLARARPGSGAPVGRRDPRSNRAVARICARPRARAACGRHRAALGA